VLPSRNSAYDLHRDPEVRRLRRAQRLLAAIGRDLARPGVRATLRARAVLVGGAERIRLEYEHPLMRLSRTAFLTTAELDGLRALLSSSHHLIRWLED
jgi:hypothetical protein